VRGAVEAAMGKATAAIRDLQTKTDLPAATAIKVAILPRAIKEGVKAVTAGTERNDIIQYP
jgi:hypothetical protein